MASATKPHTFRESKVQIAGRVGLTPDLVEASRREHGENVLTPPAREPWWRLFLEKFDDPVIRILMIAAGISLLVGLVEGGHYVEAIGILVAILLATGLAFLNEYRAGLEFDVLNQVTDEVPVKVVRDAQIATVPRRSIVVGDVVMLETGDEVPADGVVIESVSLAVDESRLTGESHAAPKFVEGEACEETDAQAAAYPPHKLLRSTLVADGHGAMYVTGVGDKTEIGQTARAATESSTEPTPLNRQLERLSKLIGVVGFTIAFVTFNGLVLRGLLTGELVIEREQLGFLVAAGLGIGVALQRVWIPIIFDALELIGREVEVPSWIEQGGGKAWLRALGLGAVVFGVLLGLGVLAGVIGRDPGMWLTAEEGRAFLQFFMIAVVIIVVAVPEGLAMSVTLSLAYSMRKMTATNNLVRRMHACETIGAATVICSDKTGTLTQNRMRLQEARFAFRPDGEGADVDRAWLSGSDPGRIVVEAMALNSTANLSLQEEDGSVAASPRVVGNPTEGAMLLWLDAGGVDYLAARASGEVLRQWAFNTQRKLMATAARPREGVAARLYVKGAPEIVLGHAKTRLGADGRAAALEPAFLDEVRAGLEALQARGMRTLGLAYRDMPEGAPIPEECDDAVQDLVWLGYLGIADPVRPEVPGAIEQCRHAGIDVKIITGDTAVTAQEIARQITLLDADHPGALLTGAEFNALDDEALKARLGRLRVLARARPADKLRLVKLLQEQRHVVAVTGDGTNDAPALNHADVGLAMGKAGTAVAKEAADIVLLDDSFPSIVNAVKWGRSLYLNIQRFILFQLTINVAACLIAMLGPYIGVQLPLTVMQMLWVNLIMDTFAALALATEPPRGDVLEDPPRNPRSFIISAAMAKQILGVGGAFVVLLVLLLKTQFFGGDTELHQLTLFFNFFVMLQFWNLFNARAFATHGASGLAGMRQNPAFLAIAVAIFVGQALIVTFGGDVFRTQPLGLVDWLKTAGLSAIVLVVGELARWRTRSRAPAPA